MIAKRILFTCIYLLLVTFGFAQNGGEFKKPLESNGVLEKITVADTKATSTRLGKNNSFKNYPFIDHFDESKLSDSLWVDSLVSKIFHGVVFNALDANGTPYGGGAGGFDVCDALNSVAINLFGAQHRTYIFFNYSTGTTWQSGDSLVLELKTASGSYRQLWTSPNAPITQADVILPFDITDFLDANFSFRFVSYSTQTASNTETFILYDCVMADKWAMPAHENFLSYHIPDSTPYSSMWSMNPVTVKGNGPLATNAVVFDARDRKNELYSGGGFYADTLTSHLIDVFQFLSTDSVLLRFFYSATPATRSSDSLLLELRNNTGQWVRVWQGGKNNGYEYVNIPFNFGRFRHANLQFRFINKATISANDTFQFLLGGIHIGKTLFIPFIDDFSTASVFPDASKWQTKSTYINAEFALNPPSINVATFDGLNAKGQPYGVGDGICDTLWSYAFNLRGLTVADSVYLSFYFQPKGFGESPNFDDSLVLEIRNNPCKPDQYITIWNTSSYQLPTDKFQRVDILLTDSLWLHDDFHFRFKNYGNRSGNINHWHVDYIRFDKGRQANDAYRDVAITTKPGSLLKPYTSMPWKHFITDAPGFTKATQNLKVRNNFNLGTPVLYSRVVQNPDPITIDSFANPIGNFLALSDSSILINDGVTINGNFTTDTVLFNSRYRSVIIGSSDNIPQNDQVVVPTVFSNFFAYDDGSAESGYGIDLEPGAVALGFETKVPDTLQGISIFFNRSYSDVSMRTFSLMVWKTVNTNGNGTGQQVLKRIELQGPKYFYQYNGFYYFKFAQPLLMLPGKFYVGWEQDQIYNLNVGWDENFEVDGKPAKNANLYYRIVDFWYKTNLNGTPMIRPIVGKWIDPPTGITEQENENSNRQTLELDVYPNPSTGTVYFGNVATGKLNIEVYDLAGKQVHRASVSDNILHLQTLQPGMYILHITDANGRECKKKWILQP